MEETSYLLDACHKCIMCWEGIDDLSLAHVPDLYDVFTGPGSELVAV